MRNFTRLFRASFLATVLSGCIIASTNAADRPLIRGAYIEFPPLAYTTEAGQLEGTFIELVEAIADRAGYDIQWQGLPIERVYLYLERGDIDMWPGSAGVPELAAYTRESNFRTGSVRLNAYSREGEAPVTTIGDLQGKNLILIRGYTYFRLLDYLLEDPDTRITMAPSHLSAIRMLAFKRGDYLINFQLPMDDALQEAPLPDLRQDNLLEWPTTLIFSRKAPGTGKMIEDMDRAWQSLKDGDLVMKH